MSSSQDNTLYLWGMIKTQFLFRPLDNIKITQYFGENKACIDNETGTKTIFCDGLNPPQGFKSIYSNMNGHNGLDLYAPTYTPVYSSTDGCVEECVHEDARGLGLGIVTDQKFYCDETETETQWKIRYWHHAQNLVKKGDKVKIGQLIALADNTGYSSGSHLHFEVKPVTINKKGIVSNTLQKNGYFGAINPLPYMSEYNASQFGDKPTWQQRLAFVLLKLLK